MAFDFGYGLDPQEDLRRLFQSGALGPASQFMGGGLLTQGAPPAGTGLLTARDVPDSASYASLPPPRPTSAVAPEMNANVIRTDQSRVPATENQSPSAWDNITSAVGQNSDKLMALGAGLMSGKNWGEGFSKGIEGMQTADKNAAITGLARQKLGQQQQGQTATLSYLMSKGLSREAAVAATLNPAILSSTLSQMTKDPSVVQVGGYKFSLRPGEKPSQDNMLGPADEQKPMTVAAGTTVFDPRTQQPIYTAPKDDGGFTLAPGQRRYEGDKLVAEAPAADSILAQAAQREQIAKANGITPGSEAYKSYIATGKLPGEDQKITATDKQAILEADETVQGTRNTIGQLQKAKELSKKAYAGPGASKLGYVTSFFGNESGVATEELHNTVVGGALESLKSTFGAAPTEGERKILLDIQGSVNQAPEVREKIFQRAIEAAERRQRFNEERAAALRGGTYYKPPASAGPTAAAPTAPAATTDPLAAARDAIAKGAPRNAVMQRLLQNGIDPKGL